VYAPSFCRFSKPEEDPAPFYDPSKDQVRCHMSSTFSRCCWKVPSVELEYPADLDRYRWFKSTYHNDAIHWKQCSIFIVDS
jgi:ATP-dependent RNA helicase DHX37/DHR1